MSQSDAQDLRRDRSPARERSRSPARQTTDAMDSYAAVIADAVWQRVEELKRCTTWTKPPPTLKARIPATSKPRFVAVRGLVHRTTAGMSVPQFETKLAGDIDINNIGVSMPVALIPANDHTVAKTLWCKVNAEKGEDSDDQRALFCFDPVWEKERADTPDEKMKVTCTGIHFSVKELRTLLKEEADDSHLVIVVVPADSEIEDMTFCETAPEFRASEVPFGPSVMALEWRHLHSALEAPSAHAFVDKNASLAWAV